MRLTLPWPDRRLSPNARYNWRVKQAPKKQARDEGFYAALEVHSVANDTPLTGDLRVTYHLHPPDKRRRDIDNLVAAMKPSLDGVCRGLAIDDSQFKQTVIEWREVVPGGQVVMIVEEM
jgi:crossover junction endodeoxyribonuclease RusA